MSIFGFSDYQKTFHYLAPECFVYKLSPNLDWHLVLDISWKFLGVYERNLPWNRLTLGIHDESRKTLAKMWVTNCKIKSKSSKNLRSLLKCLRGGTFLCLLLWVILTGLLECCFKLSFAYWRSLGCFNFCRKLPSHKSHFNLYDGSWRQETTVLKSA